MEAELLAPRIASIASYQDCDAIRRFVRHCMRLRQDIVEMLRAEDPARLVVIKPNWIQDSHDRDKDLWIPVITHPSVLIAIIEEVAELMGGRGTVALCDAPVTYANFDAVVARGDLRSKLGELRRRWPELGLEVIDLRREVWIWKEEVVVGRIPNAPDPRGYTRLDLGRDSLFYGFGGEGRYYGADYDTAVVGAHHQGEVQEYLIAGTPMACDLFINVPKLKTHKKTGITCCLKNLVGINGDKNWLPHHTKGTPETGGDEYPLPSLLHDLETQLKSLGQSMALRMPVLGSWAYRKLRNTGKTLLGDSETTVRNGNWLGNDTTWRMALDLNRALLYGNTDGSWREASAPKKYLAFVDGIEGGQGSGPVCPEPADSQVLIFGDNPAVVDAVATRLIGFDPLALPIVRGAMESHRWPISDRPLMAIEIEDEREGGLVPFRAVRPAIQGGFAPHFGWKGVQRLPEIKPAPATARDAGASQGRGNPRTRSGHG